MSIDYSNFALPKPATKKKEAVKRIKGHKHRQTKETDIPAWVKEVVWERDGHRCIFCKIWVPMKYACCHFIPRAAGGLGIPENIFTACEDCHRQHDDGLNVKVYISKAENYLKDIYKPDWNKSKLVYRKY